jgi:hypothetical protein
MTTCGTTLCDMVGQTGYAILAGTGLGFWIAMIGFWFFYMLNRVWRR